MKHLLYLIAILLSWQAAGQDLQSPEEFLGYPLGSQFTRHHEVVEYYRHVAAARPGQVRLETYGKTNERRPLMVAIVGSSTHMTNLETIRQEHLKALEGQGKSDIPVVWLSYNVHGNESVSTEASMQTLYELLTSRQDYLEHAVVILDPCINPDGRDRYVNWYNQYKNTPYQPNPESKEHQEGWWNGRSNHYMFDLNRDWAWLTQVESRQRLAKYQQWMPHIHVDFHEQSMNAPYYFAPAAEPYHEVITGFQRRFQETIGRNHARYFDANGWYYFTKEVFDLFYPSYGDTYPTYNGAIGMTYEQGGGGVAGLGVITATGDTLTLKDRIAHHLTTGLSTVEVAAGNAGALTSEFRNYYANPGNFKYKSYVMRGNPDQLDALTELLNRHNIRYGHARPGTARGFNYRNQAAGSMRLDADALVVPTRQPKGRLVKVLFEPDARLSDSLTYDITAWSLPYAYGLDALASEAEVPHTLETREPQVKPAFTESAYGYLTDWNSMADARFLAALLQEGIRVRRITHPMETAGQAWAPGTLLIQKGDNRNHPGFTATLKKIALAHSKPLTPVSGGFVDAGSDFGSRSVGMIPKARIGVLAGEPTSTLRFGEVWHFFEQQLHYPLTVLDADFWDRAKLENYDVLVLPGGRGYRRFLTPERKGRLKQWVAGGGRLIAMGEALDALGGEQGFGVRAKAGGPQATDTDAITPYAQGRREGIKSAITGAVFQTRVDPTHPLAFGYADSYFSLKLGNRAYERLASGTVAYLEPNARPVAGFAGSEALKDISGSLVFGVEAHGRGQVVYLADNPLFRGFWENGKLFFANALFMLD
ncbi:M14 family zinc carboxypeptidase [Robiginitalea sp. M366]|uniref:M14 family zinc carboxypeptidase n=1 Tax=Robiginitalea aestuariiviva TaxID=3036903 RepID=UPI00240D4B53|nr:M14 family zinc carboxypeptidase [Robiginitalea aestuariiviva]MDG1572546.1 M14 family zinc carboxypeptidase [Robiginitalea aestuariiviva]